MKDGMNLLSHIYILKCKEDKTNPDSKIKNNGDYWTVKNEKTIKDSLDTNKSST